MKGLVVFVSVVLALAYADRDLSKIISLDINPFLRNVFTSSVNPKIVGGEEAVPNSFPYQAALFIKVKGGTAFCGGSIISDSYILTAAHCVDSTKEAEVVLGAHNIRESEATQKKIIATEFIVHEGWSRLVLANDIALIKLPEKIEFSDIIKTIPLPCYSGEHKDFSNSLAVVSGWGKDSDKAQGVSPVLRYVHGPILTNEKCKKSFFGITGKKHLCMSGKGGKSSCRGDSGGPLVIGSTQEGLVSFGIALGCEIGWPSAYTRVSSFLGWINEKTGIPICA